MELYGVRQAMTAVEVVGVAMGAQGCKLRYVRLHKCRIQSVSGNGCGAPGALQLEVAEHTVAECHSRGMAGVGPCQPLPILAGALGVRKRGWITRVGTQLRLTPTCAGCEGGCETAPCM